MSALRSGRRHWNPVLRRGMDGYKAKSALGSRSGRNLPAPISSPFDPKAT
jgi:hypothetical protein